MWEKGIQDIKGIKGIKGIKYAEFFMWEVNL